MPNQRSKSGCWTCRLRRKKCPEDGPPCSNCESRGVACHGYGPRPAWKDRGDKEKEEAERLQLRRRNQTRQRYSSNATDTTSGNSIYCLLPSVTYSSPPPDLVSLSPPVVDNDSFHFALSSPTHLDPSSFAFLPEPWMPGLESIPGLTPFGDSSSIATPPLLGDNALQDPSHDGGPTPPPTDIEVVLDFPSNDRLPPSEERDIELMMQYLERDFPKQHPSYGAQAVGVRAWLMCSFRRSSTFRYASLSISTYFNFIQASSNDGARRTELFREYDQFKQLAVKAHALLLETSGGDGSRGEQSPAQCDFILGEKIVSSVQLAILESLEDNHNGVLSHLDSASLDLVQYHDQGSFIDSNQMILPRASPMERKAVEFFTCVLIWIHVLYCSTRQTIPRGASLYRQLLASNSPLAKCFVDITGLEGWVLDILMDATEVSLWKREQEAKNRLSMRELICKTDSIVATLNQLLQHDNTVQTHLFAHAIAIQAHALTSGYQPAIPEIQQTLEKATPLWAKLDPCNNKSTIKGLSWAFCVSATLASDAQRTVFEKVLSAAASADPPSAAVPVLKSIVEKCWDLLDAGAPSCNWQEVMERMGCNIHSISFA